MHVVIRQAEGRSTHLGKTSKVGQGDQKAHIIETGVATDADKVRVDCHAGRLDRVERGWRGGAQ
eukprot:scaffold202123_cov40-Tisochrysis_lutea.AAC.2